MAKNVKEISKQNEAGISIMRAICADPEFDFACFAGCRPDKLKNIMSKYPANILDTDNSFAMCCVKALLTGAKELWKIAQTQEKTLNAQLIDPAFGNLCRAYDEYHKPSLGDYYRGIHKYKGGMVDYLSRVMNGFLGEKENRFWKNKNESVRNLYNTAFCVRPGQHWDSLQRFGADMDYLFNEENGAIAVRNIMMFDTLFNRYWKEDSKNMPPQRVVDCIVDLVAKLAPRVFLPVKYFFYRASNHKKAERTYRETLESFDRSRPIGERSYTERLNPYHDDNSHACYESYGESSGLDVYSITQEWTPWEEKLERKFRRRKSCADVAMVASWVVPPLGIFMAYAVFGLLCLIPSVNMTTAYLVCVFLSFVCSVISVYRFSESVGWSLGIGLVIWLVLMQIVTQSGLLSWFASLRG